MTEKIKSFYYKYSKNPRVNDPSLCERTLQLHISISAAPEEVHSQITAFSLYLSGILGRFRMGKFLGVLWDAMEAYKKWVRDNQDFVHSLESLANVSCSLNFLTLFLDYHQIT